MSGRTNSYQRQSELKCPSCQNWYDETIRTPKRIECQHDVCVSCVLYLLGEQIQGHVAQEPFIPRNRTLSCPVCYAVVRTEGIQTNRTLAEKISALAGLEALIYTNQDDRATSSPRHQSKPQPSAPSNQPQAPPPQQPDYQPQQPEYQPQLEATGLGWAVPTESPRPEMPSAQPGGGQPHLGWTLPGAPQHGVAANLDSQHLSMLPPQQMPQPHGVPFAYPNSDPPY